MNIHFNRVIPLPLEDIKHNENSVWGSVFTLEKGENVLLNAESGKGKTTFTYLLAGLRKDYKGSIQLGNEDISDFSLLKWTELRTTKLSFVFQDLQLFGDLSVEENLKLKNQLTQTFTEKELKKMVGQLGIANKWDAPCKLLSLGQQQRVVIIRALSQPFDWLIMDEPFSHLDEKNMELASALIQNRVKELKAGIILTSLGGKHNIAIDKKLYL